MMYSGKVAVCSEILTKYWTQSEHHVEFLNVKNRVVRKEIARLLKGFISLYCFLSVQYLNYISVFQLIALN